METQTTLQERLFALQDKAYAAFQAKLVPGIPADRIIGIRVPMLRRLAKEYASEDECQGFLRHLPHRYYDENMLHAILLSQMNDFGECLRLTEAFLPYVDNWAVCDILSPKVFGKHKEELMECIKGWCKSGHPYTCRFGMEMLMTHFLDEDFKPDYLRMPASVRHEDYYVRMMVAWFFATALAKQWKAAVGYLEKRRLPSWTHNKTIQKAIESYRITAEQKDYLRGLKAK